MVLGFGTDQANADKNIAQAYGKAEDQYAAQWLWLLNKKCQSQPAKQARINYNLWYGVEVPKAMVMLPKPKMQWNRYWRIIIKRNIQADNYIWLGLILVIAKPIGGIQ